MTSKTAMKIILGALGMFVLLALANLTAHYEYHPQPVVLTGRFAQDISMVESKLPVIPGAEKHLEWRYPDHRRTPYSIVQLHGFSASRQEISPVAEKLAEKLGANLFMTRLCGHGLSAHRMENVTADCLLSDTEEAFAVGRQIGDRVILVGTSTGAALALMLAQQEPIGIAAMVLASPNFRPRSPFSLLLKGPLGYFLARFISGNHSWKAESELEEKYWTTSYPMLAVNEMMNFLSWVDQLDLSQMKVPAIVFYTETDEVISTDLVKEKFADYGGPHELVEVQNATHVLAGAIRGPKNTDFVIERAEKFLRLNLGLGL